MGDPGRGEFRGIRGSTVTVRLADGSSHNISITPKHRATNAGPVFLRSARETALRDILKQESAVRSLLRAQTSRLNEQLRSSNNKLRADGSLPRKVRSELNQLANGLVKFAVSKMEKQIRDTINRVVKREIRAQNQALKAAGQRPLNRKEIAQLVSTIVSRVMTQPYPNTEHTTQDRLRALGVRSTRLMHSAVNAKLPKRPKALDHLRRGMHDPKTGPTRVDGGSVGKAVARMSRTEQARAMRETALQIAKSRKVQLMYWRLNPRHRFQGDEICEKLADWTGPGVSAALRRAGVPRGSIDLGGLYTLRGFPDIPHPNCMCFQEMFFI